VVLTKKKVTPFPGVPAFGQHAFVHPGGSKVHVASHCTVLFDAQIRLNGPELVGGVTTKSSTHVSATPFTSVTVTVITLVPGPTGVPAAGVWLHIGGGCAALVMKQLVNWHMSGTTPIHAFVLNTAWVARHEQSTIVG
jgi:hypothetical protein